MQHGSPAVADGGRFEFTINDQAGQPHRYEVNLHRVAAGLRISLALVALGLEALAGAFAKGGVSTLGEALEVDIGGIDLSSLRAAVLSGVVEGLIFDVLRESYRDGVSLDSTTAGNALDAYRGNYAELYAAAWRVIQGNGWLPLPGGLLDKTSKGSGADQVKARR